MACCAIKKDGTRCRNYAFQLSADTDEKTLPLCWSHRRYSKWLHAIRWWHRYFQKHIFTYRWSKHLGPQMLRDLQNGWVTLRSASVGRIPATNLYIDIYTLLCSHGYIQAAWNTGLYNHTIGYILQRLFMMAEVPNPNLAEEDRKALRPYVDTFLSQSSGYHFLLQQLPSIVQIPLLQDCVQQHPYVIPEWLDTFKESELGKELSWSATELCPRLAKMYEPLPPDNSLRNHMLQRFLPDLCELYEAEKQTQKWKMDHIKEELMATTWHPDRVKKLLEGGLDPDDM